MGLSIFQSVDGHELITNKSQFKSMICQRFFLGPRKCNTKTVSLETPVQTQNKEKKKAPVYIENLSDVMHNDAIS